MGKYILTVKEATQTPCVMDHKRGPVAVSVKSEPPATVPLKLDRPQLVCLVLLFELINDEKPPILLLCMLFTQHLNGVYPPLNPCIYSYKQLLGDTRILGLRPCHF